MAFGVCGIAALEVHCTMSSADGHYDRARDNYTGIPGGENGRRQNGQDPSSLHERRQMAIREPRFCLYFRGKRKRLNVLHGALIARAKFGGPAGAAVGGRGLDVQGPVGLL